MANLTIESILFFDSEEQYELMIFVVCFCFPICKECVYVGCISAS